MKKGIIYCHTCLVTGKKYIGQTANVQERFDSIENPSLRRYPKRSALYQHAFKYGELSFCTGIIEHNLDEDQLESREIYWIETLDTIYPNGLNLTPGGLRMPPTKETRQKISHAQKGRPSWNKGIPMPAHVKQTLKEANTGKKHSKETKQKISEAQQGRYISPEHRRKISEGQKRSHAKRKHESPSGA